MELTMSAWNGTFEEWEDTRPATDVEVLAYAATLDGAEVAGFVDLWVDDDEFGEDFKVSVSVEVAANALRGLGYLVIAPLPDKETTDTVSDVPNELFGLPVEVTDDMPEGEPLVLGDLAPPWPHEVARDDQGNPLCNCCPAEWHRV